MNPNIDIDSLTEEELDRYLAEIPPVQEREITDDDVVRGANQSLHESVVEEDRNAWSYIKDVGRGVVTGASDAVEETVRAAGDLGEWMDENVFSMGYITWGENGIEYHTEKPAGYRDSTDTLDIPDMGDAETGVGSVAQGISQFVTGFVGAGKALKSSAWFGRQNAFVKGSVQGAVADFTVFDPHEQRLSDLLKEHTDLESPVIDYLAAKGNEDDTELEGRLKNAMEGAVAGTVMEGFIRSLKLLRTKYRAGHEPNIVKPKTEVEVDAPATRPEVEVPVEKLNEEIATGTLPRGNLGLSNRAAVSLMGDNLDEIVEKSDFNLDKIEDVADIQRIFDTTQKYFEVDTNRATRGVVSLRESRDNAATLADKWIPDQLNTLAAGTKNLDAKMLAQHTMLVASARNIKQLAEKAVGSGSANDLAELKKAMIVHGGIHATTKGVQTEIARALSAMRNTRGATNANMERLQDFIQRGQNVDVGLAQKLASSDITTIDSLTKAGILKKSSDVVLEVWKAGLLSGPRTWMINIASNTLILGKNVPERFIAGLYGRAFRVFDGSSDHVQMGETKEMFVGMLQGIDDAFNLSGKKEIGNVWNTIKTEIGTTDSAMQVEEFPQAIRAENFGLDNASIAGRAVNATGRVVRTPFTILQASDEFLKSIHSRQSLRTEAYRMAKAEGLEGPEFATRMAELVDNPPDEMLERAVEFAKYHTFTNALGPKARHLSAFRNTSFLAQVVVPFFRTPLNIVKYWWEALPTLNQRFRDDFAAGGARRDMAMARVTMGTAATLYASKLAMEGTIVGKFAEDERKSRMANGEREYSFVLTDENGNKNYIPFNRLEPIGMFFGVAADMVTISNEYDDDEDSIGDLTAALITSMANNVTSKTWMQGLSNLANVLNDPKRYSDSYIKSLAGSVIPSIVNEFRKEDDEYLREVETVKEAILNRIPGYSKNLPMRYDDLGNPLTQKEMVGPDWASPVERSVEKGDYRAEIARHKVIKGHSRFREIDGVKLTPEQRTRWRQLVGEGQYYGGRTMKEFLNEEIQSESYKQLNNGDDTVYGSKARRLKSLYERGYNAARGQMLQEFPEINMKAREIKMKRRGLEDASS
jgi:hypothetical protein